MDNKVFYFNMLGGCRITCGDRRIDSSNLRSKKIWEILAYLIVYRNREITPGELIDIIYSEDTSVNPANALKTLIHRVRAAVSELGAAPGKELILQQNGSYKWNNSYEVVVDAEQFEQLASRALSGSEDRETRLAAAYEAIETFKGNFLPRFSSEPWVMPLYTYYHTNYIRLCHDTVEYLAEQGQFQQVVSICQRATAIDPYDEPLYLSLMRAQISLGQTQKAMEQYKKVTRLFYREFGITPSEELMALYRKISDTSEGILPDINAAKERLREPDSATGAFFCEYEFFKSVYQLEVRSAARTGIPVHVCLITVDAKNRNAPLTNKSLNLIIDNLVELTKNALRKGDVFARISVSQLVVLLPMTTTENAEMVLNRIVKRYRASYPRSHGELSYSFQAIDTMF